MTEAEWLDDLIRQGYRPFMRLRTPDTDEIRQELPPVCWDKVVRALPLSHKDGTRLMAYLVTPDGIALGQRLADEQATVTGYAVCVYCCAAGSDVSFGTIELKSIIEDLHTATGWDVRGSSSPNTFEVRFDVHGDRPDEVEACIQRVNRAALALSVTNRVGFQVKDSSIHPTFVGQPYGITAGLPVRLATPSSPDDLAAMSGAAEDAPRIQMATIIRDFYSQTTWRTKLVIGWAALEELFRSPAVSILLESERDQLVRMIQENQDLQLTREAREKIVSVLQDRDRMAKATRNERMACDIAPLLGEPATDVLKSIADAARARGRGVHSTTETENIHVHVQFIEHVLWARWEQTIAPVTVIPPMD